MTNTLTINSENLLNKAQSIFDTIDVRKNTREDYKKSIKVFIGYVEKHPLTNNSFLEFKRYLGERTDIGVSSKNKYLITARILLKELSKIGAMADITQNVKGFAQGKKHKKDGLNDNDVKKLMDVMRTMPDSFVCLRFKALVSLFVYQGLRQKEVAGLDVEHINLVKGVAMITGKGRDDFEPINLHPESIAALRNYMLSIGRSTGALFFGRGSDRLCCMSIRRLITNQFLTLGIFKSVHGIRHFFVGKLIESFGGNLVQVAQFTRHKSLDMLTVYNDAILTSKALPQYYNAFNGI